MPSSSIWFWDKKIYIGSSNTFRWYGLIMRFSVLRESFSRRGVRIGVRSAHIRPSHAFLFGDELRAPTWFQPKSKLPLEGALIIERYVGLFCFSDVHFRSLLQILCHLVEIIFMKLPNTIKECVVALKEAAFDLKKSTRVLKEANCKTEDRIEIEKIRKSIFDSV